MQVAGCRLNIKDYRLQVTDGKFASCKLKEKDYRLQV